MGRRLIEHDIPEIHHQLKRIADALDKKDTPEKEYIWFIEELEASTDDRLVTKKIRDFLVKKNIWKTQAHLE
jgi:chaperonin cofactor prefoldin